MADVLRTGELGRPVWSVTAMASYHTMVRVPPVDGGADSYRAGGGGVLLLMPFTVAARRTRRKRQGNGRRNVASTNSM